MNSGIQKLEELMDTRIIIKNLVYIIGQSPILANKDKLSKYEYLGQYGTILKIETNIKNQNNRYGPLYSVYVTFSKPSEASIALLSLDDQIIDNHLIRASFVTTRYCSKFLKGVECNNKECLFLHQRAPENDIIKRGNLSILIHQHNEAMNIANIYNPEVKKRIMSSKKGKTVFPSPDTIYKTNPLIKIKINNSEKIESQKLESEMTNKEE